MHNTIPYEDLLGIPFKLNGRSADGIDCYGVALEMSRRGGYAPPDFSYEHDHEATIAQLILDNTQLADKLGQPEPYCLVTFRSMYKFSMHIGVVLPCLTKFLHVPVGGTVRAERLAHPTFRNRITGYYRWKPEFSLQKS